MKYLSNDRGVLPILVAVLVVVLLAAAGVAAYNVSKSHQKNVQTAKASPSPTSSPLATSSAVPTATPTASSYLDIKELGVKIRLTDDIKDAVYAIVGGTSAKISSQSLIDASADCKPGAVGPLGTVGKTTNANQGFGVLTPNNDTVFKFGDSYIYYQTPQSPCGAPQDMANKQLQSFEQAFKTVQPD